MPKSSAFRHSRIYRRKIRGACPRIFQILIEIGLRPKSLIDFCNSLTGRNISFLPVFCIQLLIDDILHPTTAFDKTDSNDGFDNVHGKCAGI